MDHKPPEAVGRLAFREEGEFWNCYYAMPDTMADAILLGSLRMAIAQRPELKAAFMALMRQVLADFVQSMFGGQLIWPRDPVPAPEHERTKPT